VTRISLHYFSMLALFVGGCMGGGGDPGPAEVELGTGTVAFETLAAEQELELLAGPQGGHHFIVHARASGIAPGDPTMPGLLGNPATMFQVWSEGGEQLDLRFPPYRLGYVHHADDWQYLPSGRILQVIEDRVVELYGQRVRIAVRVQDAEGRVAVDERWVVAVEERDPPDFGDAGVGVDGGLADAGQ
jgi:hypothetical protein